MGRSRWAAVREGVSFAVFDDGARQSGLQTFLYVTEDRIWILEKMMSPTTGPDHQGFLLRLTMHRRYGYRRLLCLGRESPLFRAE